MFSSTTSRLRCDDFSTEAWCWQGRVPFHEGRFGMRCDLQTHADDRGPHRVSLLLVRELTRRSA